jgi:hypothetical protein
LSCWHINRLAQLDGPAFLRRYYGYYSNVSREKKKGKARRENRDQRDRRPTVNKELKKRWSYFISI